jgi:hypothetical protein
MSNTLDSELSDIIELFRAKALVARIHARLSYGSSSPSQTVFIMQAEAYEDVCKVLEKYCRSYEIK